MDNIEVKGASDIAGADHKPVVKKKTWLTPEIYDMDTIKSAPTDQSHENIFTHP